MKKGYLILQDGQVFEGVRFGAETDTVGELVFTTGMCGYVETLTDPSYAGQIVMQTYPLIGNYGIADEDFETRFPTIGGLIVGEYNDHPSNFRCTKTLSEILEDYGIPGIEGVDTRRLTRSIRDLGSRRCLITSAGMPLQEGLALLRSTPLPTDAVRRVSAASPGAPAPQTTNSMWSLWTAA